MKTIIKYFYLLLGLVHFSYMNYLSYKDYPSSTSSLLSFKITFSVISFVLLTLIYILLIYPKLIVKKELKKETIIALYIGVVIVPLISLNQ